MRGSYQRLAHAVLEQASVRIVRLLHRSMLVGKQVRGTSISMYLGDVHPFGEDLH
jgi:hypothetical protein